MEKYRKDLKTRIMLLIIPALLAVGLGVFSVFFASESTKGSLVFEFQCGAATALGLISVVMIMRSRSILKDDEKLKAQYNKENDERLKAIRAKAGIPVLLYTSSGMMVAAIVAGYFHPVVFTTLIIAVACQLLISVIVKQIYLRKI